MKHIWELLAKAKQQELNPTDITFIPAKEFSPYLEISFENLNDNNIPSIVEVNPYYRFLTVFKDYFAPDYHDDEKIRNELFNLIVHYLAELDTYMGMTKRDYEIIHTYEDILSGHYGDEMRDSFNLFNLPEKKIVASNLLKLHELSEGVYLFQKIIIKLYPKASIYGNLTDNDTLFVHLLVEENEEHKLKLKMLKTLFLPVYYELEIYWINLFGIIGVDASMILDEIVMY